MKRILVLRGGALGDFIVTLPALAALRRLWPQAEIDLVGNVRAAELGRSVGLIDRVESQNLGSWHTLWTDAPAPGLRERLARYELVINTWPDPDGALARHFAEYPGQLYLTGAALPQVAPAARHYHAALAPLNPVPPDDWCYHLRPWQPWPRRIAIHPGSGAPRKNWPADRWAAVARWLNEEFSADVHIIVGEAEPPGLLAESGTILDRRPLAELAEELAHCRLFLGHDSGISHLAAACGCPGVLLFGPTDPAMWAPPTRRMQVLRPSERLADISIDLVQRAVRAALPDRK